MNSPADDKPIASAETLHRLAVLATAATIALTGAAFWLSYEHLHDVANHHGLAHIRAWAWPATVDLFILIGEVLILIASLRRRVDRWAITLAVLGSGGSIALNVAGVGDRAAPMDYVVAAVPPVAALLAFGALMRQLHGALAARAETDTPAEPTSTTGDPAVDSFEPSVADSTPPVVAVSVDSSTTTTVDSSTDSAPTTGASSVDSDSDSSADKKAAKTAPARRQKARRTSAKKASAPRRSLDEWVDLASPIFHSEFARLRRQPTANEFATAIAAAGLGSVSDSTAKNIRTEILDRTELPVLD